MVAAEKRKRGFRISSIGREARSGIMYTANATEWDLSCERRLGPLRC